MKLSPFLLIVGAFLSAFTAIGASAAARPNVVLIVCDDLNDYVTGIPGETGHPQSLTPNVERLAATGVSFRRAYSNNPVCAPSRSSFLTGIYPHTSGNLFWAEWYKNPVLGNSKTIMEHFRDNGYHVTGSGKRMHHHKREVWEDFHEKADYGPFAHDGEDFVAHPSVPQKYFDQFPLDALEMPVIRAGDAEDTHYTEVFDQNMKGLKYFRLLGESYPDRALALYSL